ncbi:MAG: hypothetical protein J4G05_00650 [Chlorobi bacterium]|nr:hypothetical protein [Chlorobiota bacterium]
MKTGRLYLIGLLFIIPILHGCEDRDDGPANIIELPDDLPEDEANHTTILHSDSAWTKAILEAGHARKYRKRQETLIDHGLHVKFLGKDGRINVILKADSARLDDTTGDMCAFGRVNVYSRKNKTSVNTDKLCYDRVNERFHSDVIVHLVDTLKGRSIRGKGFESDEGLKEYEIYQVSADVSRN